MEKQIKPKAVIVIFGATGDLAKRKLYPSIYRMYRNGKIADFAVIGAARRPWTNETLRENVEASVKDLDMNDQDLQAFSSHFYYQPVDVTQSSSYQDLNHLIQELEGAYQTDGNRVFYLAMAPEFFGLIAKNLKAHGLKEGAGWTRLVIEKPFGHDLPSAKQLNKEIRSAFEEEQIYRIDHYLGKEMVQNIEVIRFANGLFEHLWNNRFISNIQITSSESLGVEERARYYDHSGATRDMAQNHMMQMVALLAMEPPINLTTEEVRSEKIKVLRAMRHIKPDEVDDYFVRGQYGPGEIDGVSVKGYREETDELQHSDTETFVAGKIMIDNYRWAGVPFYIRTGKRMTEKSTKIVVEFRNIPMNLYYEKKEDQHPNLLVINISPEEGVTLYLNAKKDQVGHAEPIKLAYNNNFTDHGINTPEAYEKLLYDCLLGDATNFTHWDEVALSWSFIDAILAGWRKKQPDFPNYAAGKMGPDASDALLKKDGHHWWPIGD
ncbi:glucose-6-phosphate dehydrogenase [Virgibacillus sp. 179-BFC.A HS]|uniref:Glucose-6-phosphate 1-dehydrogenase n=1 Tax=Tigheibacillus jepli TaxID=3035914 RepID=A0ABU5CF04_9BACI|nr:glucose-6-phosphate dehydrogenase [Virgibacillus sp. 179-BFC.A HS]MDY0404591.1 glucose-6-phosphate dehydrogenase [Virgibacillus sp. 179-BFC.A HS]